MKAVGNFEGAAARIADYWSPKIVGRVNDQYIKVAKLKGTFTWHKHDEEDELFIVIKGRLTIEYEDGPVHLGAGDFHVVPRGTMHNPTAPEECWIVLIEPVTTKHTGDAVTPLTKSIEQQLSP